MAKTLKKNINLVPIILIIFVLPLMVFGKNQNVPETVLPYLNVPIVTDIFTYYKSLFINIIGLYCGIFLIYTLFFNKKDKVIIEKKYFYLFLAYIFISFLSAANSNERYISFFGLFGSNEGFFTILSYLLICIYTIYVVKNKKQFYFLLTCFLVSMALYSFIPISQYLGKDFFQTKFGINYISSTLINSNLSFLSRPFSMYFVFQNSNQFGVYMSMLFVLAFTFLTYHPKKINYLFFVIATILLLGTNSRAAFISTFICISIYLVYIIYKKQINIKLLLSQIIVIIIAIIGMNYYSNGSTLLQFDRTLYELFNYKKVQVNAPQNISHPERIASKDFTSNLVVNYELNKVIISDGITNMYVYSDNGYIKIYDNNILLKETFYLSEKAFYFDYELTNKIFFTVKDHFLVIEDNKGFKIQFYVDTKGLFSIRETTPNITNLEYKDGNIILLNNFCPLKVVYSDNKYTFIDCKDKQLNLLIGGQSSYFFEDERYNDYIIWIYGNYLALQKGSRILFFEADGSQIYTVDSKGQRINFDEIERFGFRNREFLGSGRGYLFSRSIPLVKNTLLWGYGPDTFMINYPQNDYIGKTLYLDSHTTFVEGPHNLFIRQAIDNGLLSVLIFLSMIFIFFYDIYKDIKKNKNITETLIILFSILSFLIVSCFNDSNVYTMVMFFVLFGMGIKMNLLNRS